MTIRSTALAALAVISAAAAAQAEPLKTGGIPLTANNVVIGTNIAAGINNMAQQQLMAGQRGGMPAQGPVATRTGVGLDLSGAGPLVTTDVAVATNLAAGIGNHALQGFGALQGR